MRRLARPSGLSRRYTQQQQQQQQQQHRQYHQHQQQHRQHHHHHHHHHHHQHQQRCFISNQNTLSPYPCGTIIHQGHAPRRKNFPTFELPDLVLDLDAEHNPHVRSYDHEKDGPLQNSKWGYAPRIDEIKTEAASLKADIERNVTLTTAAAQQPFHYRHVSDHDIMAVALLVVLPRSQHHKNHPHDAQEPGTPTITQLDDVFESFHVPQLLRSHPNKTIPFLFRLQQLTLAELKDPSKRDASRGDDEQQFKDNLDMCADLVKLRRLCSRIDRPDTGVELSAASIEHVHGRLLEFLRAGKWPATAVDILKFVNNMTIKHVSANKELNRPMTLFGLQLASQLGQLSCILQYLQICLSLGFITDRTEGLNPIRATTGNAILTVLRRGRGTARATRQQILTLLTGRGPDATAPQEACLFGLVTDDDDAADAGADHQHQQQPPEVRNLCVALLGELGALRLLVHSWRRRPRRPDGTGGADDEEVFADAFWRCAQILGPVEAEAAVAAAGAGLRRGDLATAPGGIARDAALDWRTINAVDAFHARRGSRVPLPRPRPAGGGVATAEIVGALDAPGVGACMRLLAALVNNATAAGPGGADGGEAPRGSTLPERDGA